MHGGPGGNSYLFEATAGDALGRSFHVLSYDRRGTGRSPDGVAADFSFARASEDLHQLVTATIRSVATGVIGVAFIQAILLGIGFIGAGIPAAGLLAIVVMIVGIIQLPALLVSLPAIGYIWWAGGDATC